MKASYKKLWKILIDKEMMKKDLHSQAGISRISVIKLSKGENVGMEVLIKICTAFDCYIGDIVGFIKDENSESIVNRAGRMLTEETNEKSEAYKAGYKTICEIGEERSVTADWQVTVLQ